MIVNKLVIGVNDEVSHNIQVDNSETISRNMSVQDLYVGSKYVDNVLNIDEVNKLTKIKLNVEVTQNATIESDEYVKCYGIVVPADKELVVKGILSDKTKEI